jgi:hypothetical protein
MMTRKLAVAVVLAYLLAASPCMAWHEVGHILTVLVAYKQLSPGNTPSETVKRLVAILKHHPRFQEDFAAAMPKGLTEDGEARWLLCRASVWPDQIRTDRDNPPSFPAEQGKQGSFHRGNWHYIDTPLCILPKGAGAEQAKELEAKGRALQPLGTDCPTDEAKVKNVIQAIAFNHQRLAHGTPGEQAVALCWLLHLLGDIHQPLHAVTAFSPHLLNPASQPNGDKGGNGIRLATGGNLHALWDAAPDATPDASFDPDEPFEHRYQRAYDRAVKQGDEILASKDLLAQGKKAAGELDPAHWARESFDLASSDVYTAEVREKILAADQAPEQSDEGVAIQVSDSYRAKAHAIGKRRVVEGGCRMAAFLVETR